MSDEASKPVPDSTVDEKDQSPDDASQEPTSEQDDRSPNNDPQPTSDAPTVKEEDQSPASDSQQPPVEPVDSSAPNTLAQAPVEPVVLSAQAPVTLAAEPLAVPLQTPAAPAVEPVDSGAQASVAPAAEPADSSARVDSAQRPVASAVEKTTESSNVDFRKRSTDQEGDSPSDALRSSSAEQENRNPIDGYQRLPVFPLEEALKDLIPSMPSLAEDISTAKDKCNKSSTLLTPDESAAIYLYTMASPFIYYISVAFQTGDRDTLKPWLPYLKLFTTAVEKLPSVRRTVWRGLGSDDIFDYPEGTVCTWWQITSCSINIRMAEDYLVREYGTLFAIDAAHGKDISTFSAFPDEQEVILLPGTRLRFVGEGLNYRDSLALVHLQEENDSPAS